MATTISHNYWNNTSVRCRDNPGSKVRPSLRGVALASDDFAGYLAALRLFYCDLYRGTI